METSRELKESNKELKTIVRHSKYPADQVNLKLVQDQIDQADF